MSASIQLSPGATFARDFRIVRPLAEGGMGAVYVAEQLSTGHERALKVMLPQLVPDEKSRARFQQEARVAAKIASDHVVQVVAAGVDDTTAIPWLAMELLLGEDLAAYLGRHGPLTRQTAAEIFRQLGHGLSAAHRVGLVHRDLKPENIFIAVPRRSDAAFTVKVLDFGIAKILDENRTAATATAAMGSPLWMAPEQLESDGMIRPATDVWALGLIAFRMLTNRYYWRAANAEGTRVASLLREIVVDPLEPASVRAASLAAPAQLPAGFDSWFARCVARLAVERLPDAEQAVALLLAILHAADTVSPSTASRGPLPAPAASASVAATIALPMPAPSRVTSPNGSEIQTPPSASPGGSATGRRRVGRWAGAAAVLLVAVGSAVLLRPPRETRRTTAVAPAAGAVLGGPVRPGTWPQIDPTAVTEILITRASGPPIQIEKLSAQWSVVRGDRLPADQRAVASLLDTLAHVQLVAEIDGRRGVRGEPFDGDSAVDLTVRTLDTTVLHVSVGQNLEPGTAVYLDGRVYQTDRPLRAAVSRGIVDWYDLTVTNLDLSHVRAVEWENVRGHWRLVHNETGWTVAAGGPQLARPAPSRVNQIVSNLLSIRGTNLTYLGDRRAPGSQSPRVTIELDAGAAVTLRTGELSEDEAVARRSDRFVNYVITRGVHDDIDLDPTRLQ